MAIVKKIRPQLTNTWETIEMLRAQYESLAIKNDKLDKFYIYYKAMNDFERDILVLYAEYGSYRKVAEETYCSHSMVSLIMDIIRREIQAL